MNLVPAPLVASDVDLRGYEFMPLYGDRLFKSETWIKASAEAKVAAMRLWWQAYAHEVPAASLPDSDVLLAEYAGYGVAVKAWQKIKPQVMHNFVLCSDGRLYHEHLAAWALEAWDKRLSDRKRKADWRKRHKQKDGDGTGTETGTDTVTERGRDADVPVDKTGQDRTGTTTPPNSPPRGASPKRRKTLESVTFDAFVERCKAAGEQRVPVDDPVRAYAVRAGIPDDFIGLAWKKFRHRHSGTTKRYKDWRRAFRNSVEDCWYRLWFFDGDGACRLTTTGEGFRRSIAETADA